MQPKPNIVNLPVYQPGKPVEEVQRELGLTEVIKLASNENPFGASPNAKEAIQRELANISVYPDGGAVELTKAVARFHNVNPDQVLFGAGLDEMIALITRAYLRPGDETVMADSTFPQYRHNAVIENATVIEVPLRNGTHDLPAMLEKITPKTRIVWICNPNNPTGTMVKKAELEAFLARVPSGVMVVLDEAYFEYVTDPDYPNGLDYLKQYPNLLVLRTFSKIYGLASLRIGYAIGDPGVLRSINQVRGPFNTSRFAQAAALAALEDQEFVARCREANREGIAQLQKAFARMGLDFFPSHGNFVLVDTGRPAQAVFEALLRKGVIVRPGHRGYPQHVRITVGSREDNAKVIAALEEVLQEVKV